MESINERTTIVFGTGKTAVVVTQIAGILARRILCWAKIGQDFRQGEQFGLIRFGSANEIVFGPEWEIIATEGQRVQAGLTVLARRK
jgi:phosphatidylserine decarboxylase